MALTEEQITFLYFFCMEIVSFKGVTSKIILQFGEIYEMNTLETLNNEHFGTRVDVCYLEVESYIH